MRFYEYTPPSFPMEDVNLFLKRCKLSGVYLSIVEEVKRSGRLPSLALSRQARNKYVSRLKKWGIIKPIAYGIWEVAEPEKRCKLPPPGRSWGNPPPPLLKGVKEVPKEPEVIRGNGFAWRLRINDLKNWGRREEYLLKKGVIFKNIPGSKNQSFKVKDYTVWLCSQSIIFYAPDDRSFWGSSAKVSAEVGRLDVLNVIYELERLLKVGLRRGGVYQIKLFRQHFGDVNNELAKDYVKNKQRLSVSGSAGEWLLIDNSHQTPELETVHPLSAPADMDEIIKPFFTDLKDNKPPLLSVLAQDVAYIKLNLPADKSQLDYIG